MSDTVANHKVYDASSPSAPSGRRNPKITVEYHKPSRQSTEEYQELLGYTNARNAAAEYPFVPSTQSPPPPSSHNASKPPKSQQKFYADPNPTGTAPTAPLYGLAEVSFSPTPADNMGITSRSRGGSVTTEGKKGMLGFRTDFPNSHKRPEISTPYVPVHLTHVGFDSSTRKYTGLPKIWQQLLQDSGVSESDQEKSPPAVMEKIKFYQEGGGDVWDKMGHAPVQGISPPPPIPGAAPAAYPGAQKSVNASAGESRNSPNADDAERSQATVASNGTVAERPAPQQQSAAIASLAKAAGATPRRHEKKKDDEANDADIVKRLQQICTDADPTRLYRNLVKIGQG
jgi:p21-activated kinase 1